MLAPNEWKSVSVSFAYLIARSIAKAWKKNQKWFTILAIEKWHAIKPAISFIRIKINRSTETASLIRVHEIREGSNSFNRNQSFDFELDLGSRKSSCNSRRLRACKSNNWKVNGEYRINWLLCGKEGRREHEPERKRDGPSNLTVSLATVSMTTATQLLSAKYRGEILRRHKRSDEIQRATPSTSKQSITEISYDFVII